MDEDGRPAFAGVPAAVGRVGEFLGLFAAFFFTYELIAVERTFPTYSAISPRDVMSEDGVRQEEAFLIAHNRTIVFMQYYGKAGNTEDDFSEDGTISGNSFQSPEATSIAWSAIMDSPLVEAVDGRAEDHSVFFVGPVFVERYEEEGLPYLNIAAAPYTDGVARKARCSRELFGLDGIAYFVTYVSVCVFQV